MPVLQDLRFAARTMRARPLAAAVAVLSVALGIGANTAVFTLADQMLLRTLPVPEPDRLVSVTGGRIGAYGIYRELRDRNQVFSALCATSWERKMAMRVGDSEAEIVKARMVTGNFFPTLRVGAALGRVLVESDDAAPGANPVAVLGYGLWAQRFRRNPAAVGSRITLNGYPVHVVGVAESGFHGIEAGQDTQVYLPISMTAQVIPTSQRWANPGWNWLWAMGRLKPGVSMRQAEASLNVILPQVAEAVAPLENRKAARKLPDVQVIPGAQGVPFVRRRFAQPVTVLVYAAGFVLLIACANVANLLLASAAARRREMAIRLAIGATRSRLIRQLLTESALLAAIGGAAGVILAVWMADALTGLFSDPRVPLVLYSTLNWRVLAFAAAMSTATGLLFGLFPALRASGSEPAAGFRPGRTAGALAAVQIALSLVLLVCAGLFAGTLRNLRNIDPGFNREHVLLVDVTPGEHGYKGQRLRTFLESLADRTRSHPGVMSASLALITPLSGAFRTSTVSIEGYQPAPGEKMELDFNNVSRGYFATMGIPILAGRDFLPEDEPVETLEGGPAGAGVTERGERPRPAPVARRVAVVNESFARHFLGGNALGRRLSYFGTDAWFEIVGVVRDVRYRNLTTRTPYMIYVPNWINGAEWRMLAVRTAGNPKDLIAAIRADVRALDPGVPVQEVITLADQVDATLATERLMAHISTAFAIIALLLAAIGLYGVLAQNVARRTKEIGIRMALGADRRGILAMVVRQTGALAVAGIALGSAGAAAAARLVAKMLYGVQPLDVRAYAAAAILLLVVAIAAAWVPARRAASVDPTDALHYE